MTILSSDLVFTTTERGAQCLLENGFHTQNTESEEILYNDSACRGVCAMQEYTSKIRSLSAELINIVTNLLLLFFIAPRSRQLSNEELLIPKMVRRTHTILTSSLKDTTEHSAIYLPKLDSLKQTIRRARKRALNVPLESDSFNRKRQIKEKVFFYTTLAQVVKISAS